MPRLKYIRSSCRKITWAFILVIIPLIFTNSSYAVSLLDHVITDDFQAGTTCPKPVPKTNFEVTDSKVYSWVHLSDASLLDELTWKWIDPENSLYATVPWKADAVGSICVASWMGILGHPAANKTGSWKTEIYIGNTLAATDTFSIGVPKQPDVPKVTFLPLETEVLMGGEVFDLVIQIESSTTPMVNSFSMSYNDMDITQTFFAWLDSGFIQVSVNGNLISVTFPGISLPSGTHRISVTVGNPNGTTTADWSMNMATPKYSLSDVQKNLVKENGHPDYLSILFNADQKRREETWTYVALEKMYLFWDGIQVGEKSVGIDPTLYANPPLANPALFTDKTKPADVINLFGNNYTIIDLSSLNLASEEPDFKTYYFEEKGVLASFVGSQLVFVQTTDIPAIETENMGNLFMKETQFGSFALLAGLEEADKGLSPIQTVMVALYVGFVAISPPDVDFSILAQTVAICLDNRASCRLSLIDFINELGKDKLTKIVTLGFLVLATSAEIIEGAETACDGNPPKNEPGITCPVECASFTYSAWSDCQPDGTQTRTEVSRNPEGCTGDPILVQSCEYHPPCTSYEYSDSGCVASEDFGRGLGTITRTYRGVPEGCVGNVPQPEKICCVIDPC